MMFREKPRQVEAVQFTGGAINFDELEEFVGGDCSYNGKELTLAGPKGPLRMRSRDWVYKSGDDFFVMSADEFARRYERTA